MPSSFIHTLSSFSGSDLVVSFANKTFGNLQSISWGIQREKVPVFTLGSSDARSVSRGKRAIGGSAIFATFDHDSLLEAMKEIWERIAPPAMFTAAGNVSVQGSEDFSNAMDMARWNATGEASFEDFSNNPRGEALAILNGIIGVINSWETIISPGFTFDNVMYHPLEAVKPYLEEIKNSKGSLDTAVKVEARDNVDLIRKYINSGNFAQAKSIANESFKGSLEPVKKCVIHAISIAENAVKNSAGMAGYPGTGGLTKATVKGSNNTYDHKSGNWNNDGDDIYVPQGFSPIRGENVLYADMIPPIDATLTFANEYGQCAFKKIYDMDFLNEGSGVSVDTIVMEQQFTYIARRISPLIKGVYSRESGGVMKGLSPVASKSAKAYNLGYAGPNQG